MNKKGFISTALIYTFFILFLVLMVFLLNNYSSTRYIVDRYRYDIEEELYELSNADINVYTYVWSNRDKEYKYVDNIPQSGLRENISYCKNKSTIEFNDGEVTIGAKGKEFCYLYFDPVGDVTAPTITASDGKGETSWHKGRVSLRFSGSTIQSGSGGIEYFYSTDASNINNEGTSTGAINTEGIIIYYAKACNTYDLEICSEVASYELKIDMTPPTITFGLDGQTATYTCSNGGSGSPLSGTTSGTHALSGTSNYTYLATCTDEAGNSNTTGHVYKYNNCLTTRNTCRYGCATTAHYVDTCPSGYTADYTCNDAQSYGDCLKKVCNPSKPYECGWEYIQGFCKLVPASGCDDCYYGSPNSCVGGFEY